MHITCTFCEIQLYFCRRHHLDSDLYRCRMCLASMYQRSGNLSQAIRFLDAAQKIAVKLRDKQLECDTLTTKAMVCQLAENHSISYEIKLIAQFQHIACSLCNYTWVKGIQCNINRRLDSNRWRMELYP